MCDSDIRSTAAVYSRLSVKDTTPPKGSRLDVVKGIWLRWSSEGLNKVLELPKEHLRCMGLGSFVTAELKGTCVTLKQVVALKAILTLVRFSAFC